MYSLSDFRRYEEGETLTSVIMVWSRKDGYMFIKKGDLRTDHIIVGVED
jgi:hypothetical protein